MQLIAVLALSLSGLVSDAKPTTTADTAAPAKAESCDDVRARMTPPNMTPAQQNKMLDAVSACYAKEEEDRKKADAANPKPKGVNLWD
ncbi:hypothetical protein [Stenotrophomonas sp. PD6]|uniref:hypothetical protein n=1 Tax=Stenotrophomonas sp. PD6 TaxID=3368612 RepID=UPI003BA318D4